jgi:hypothetical protein
VQGIDYPALLSTNFLPGGADLGGIATMRTLLTRAASQCPNSKLLAGGYSQGAALTHRAIEDLPQSVKDRIVGVVTFGDTQNLQDRGQIVSPYPLISSLACWALFQWASKRRVDLKVLTGDMYSPTSLATKSGSSATRAIWFALAR